MPKRIFRIDGKVINLQGIEVPNLRIEGWDKDLLLNDFLGSAVTDSEGKFIIEFSDERFREFFLDRLPDVFFIVYSGSKKLTDTRNTLMRNLKEKIANVTIEVDLPAGEKPPEIADGFVAKGFVTGMDERAPEQVLVKAFDVRRRERQLLGEIHTEEGHYEVLYGKHQLIEPDKGYANLKLESFDPVATTLRLGESDVVFKAPPVLELDVEITRSYSEYERYSAIVRKATKGDALSALGDEDIPFLSNETGIESQPIEYLIAAAGLGKKTEQPAAFFYGLARQDLPPNLSDLLEQGSETLREALETALDENIIPSDLREQIDSFTDQLKKLAKVDHGIQTKQQKEKLKQLGKIIHLGDTKLEAVLKRVSSPVTLDDRALKSLVESGELEEKEAKELGLVTSLNTLFDGNMDLVTAVKKGTFAKLPQGKLSRMVDLVTFEKEDWLELIKASNMTLPQDSSEETHAELMTKTIEHLFPSKALWTRLVAKEAPPLEDEFDTLQTLFKVNKSVFKVDFKRLKLGNLDEATLEKTKSAVASLKRFANSYPGLHLTEILDDPKLPPTKKRDLVTDRLDVLKRFEKTNRNVEFLKLDYGQDSTDVEALNFTGFSENERRMVLNNLKAYQRIHAVTRDASTAKKVLVAGYTSPTGVANKGFTELMLATGMSTADTRETMHRAQEMANKTAVVAYGVVETAGESIWGTGIGNSSQEFIEFLRRIDGWESLFGNQDYCRCPHCRSVLSPAAYFVDLMHFVEIHCRLLRSSWTPQGREFTLVEVFNDADAQSNRLHLYRRRLDLWKLPLTCENTNKRIPYLDIINEVLENYIAVEVLESFAGADLPRPGEDRNAVEAAVYAELSSTARSFRQPFHLSFERLTVFLKHFGIERGDIARLLDEPADDIAAATLHLSKSRNGAPREYELITNASPIAADVLDPVYGIRFETDPDTMEELTFHDPDPRLSPVDEEYEQSRKDVQVLLKAIGLTRDDLDTLITTQFVSHTVSVEIRSAKRIDSGPDESVQNDIERIHGLSGSTLDRMHRFVRLWRHLPWTIRELDLVLSQRPEARPDQDIDAKTIEHVASILKIQQRFGLSVEECCTLWSGLPAVSISVDTDSLFDRRFNLPDFVRSDGDWPAPSEGFLHPAFLDATLATGQQIETAWHRLKAGVRVDDEIPRR